MKIGLWSLSMKINPKVFGSVFGLLAFLSVNASYIIKGFYIDLSYIKSVLIYSILFYMAGIGIAIIINQYKEKPVKNETGNKNKPD